MTFLKPQLADPATYTAFKAGFTSAKGQRNPYSKTGDKRYLAQAFNSGRNLTRMNRNGTLDQAWTAFLELEGYYADSCHGTDVAKVAAGVTRMVDLPADL